MIVNLNDLEVLKTNDNYVFNDNLKANVNTNLYMSIVCTNNCQCKCPYCINGNTNKNIEMPLDKALKNIYTAKHLLGIKECVILGGEPTLYSRLNELIDGLNSMSFNKICLTTNGIKLKESYDFIKYGITHLNISIHTDNDKFNINNLTDFYKKVKIDYPNVKIRVNTNVWKGNHDTLESLNEWIQRLQGNCDSIRVSNIILKDSFSVNSINNTESINLIHTDEYYNQLFDDLINYYSDKMTCIDNPNSLGFVDYTLIPIKSMVIVNRNINSKVSQQIICENEDKKINTIKCLVNGELSLSWNTNNIIKL